MRESFFTQGPLPVGTSWIRGKHQHGPNRNQSWRQPLRPEIDPVQILYLSPLLLVSMLSCHVVSLSCGGPCQDAAEGTVNDHIGLYTGDVLVGLEATVLAAQDGDTSRGAVDVLFCFILLSKLLSAPVGHERSPSLSHASLRSWKNASRSWDLKAFSPEKSILPIAERQDRQPDGPGGLAALVSWLCVPRFRVVCSFLYVIHFYRPHSAPH